MEGTTEGREKIGKGAEGTEGAKEERVTPSEPQLQGVIATVSEGDRAIATLCLSQDASRSDCRD